ncbi:hypothetical protein BC826DRAFT_1056501, partial [Russula brevipes]
GVIWLFFTTIAEVPAIVIIGLGLNGNVLSPSLVSIEHRFSKCQGLITLSIAASRVHRCLVDFVHGSTDISQNNFRGSGLPVAKAVRATASQVSLDQMEVVVHKAYLPFSTSESSHDGSFTGADRQVHHGPTELISDEHLGSNAENLCSQHNLAMVAVMLVLSHMVLPRNLL